MIKTEQLTAEFERLNLTPNQHIYGAFNRFWSSHNKTKHLHTTPPNSRGVALWEYQEMHTQYEADIIQFRQQNWATFKAVCYWNQKKCGTLWSSKERYNKENRSYHDSYDWY